MQRESLLFNLPSGSCPQGSRKVDTAVRVTLLLANLSLLFFYSFSPLRQDSLLSRMMVVCLFAQGVKLARHDTRTPRSTASRKRNDVSAGSWRRQASKLAAILPRFVPAVNCQLVRTKLVHMQCAAVR